MTDGSPSQTSTADWRTYFYLSAQLIGGIGLSVLLATILWPTKKRKPRNPLLISLCFSWWISTFPCLCILYYAGQVTGTPPSTEVCMLSASLALSQSLLVSATSLALVFHIWLVIRSAVRARFDDSTWIRWSTIFFVAFPYGLFIVCAVISLSVGVRNPVLVQRASFYCVIDDDKLTTAVGVLGTIFVSLAIIFEAWTMWLLYQNRVLIRRLTCDGHELEIPLALRVCIFGVYMLLGLCLDAISIVRWNSPTADLFYSTFGIAVFVVFGTQPDIWRIWRHTWRNMFYRFDLLLPRPSLRHLPRSSPTSSSFNNILSVLSSSPRHYSHNASSRQCPRTEEYSVTQSKPPSYHSRQGQVHMDTIPAHPLPAKSYFSPCGKNGQHSPACPSYTSSNSAQRTPTASASPDVDFTSVNPIGKLPSFAWVSHGCMSIPELSAPTAAHLHSVPSDPRIDLTSGADAPHPTVSCQPRPDVGGGYSTTHRSAEEEVQGTGRRLELNPAP